MRVPEENFTKDDEAGTARVFVEDLPLLDTFVFPSDVGVPAKVTFDITWTATGAPRILHQASNNPLDPRAFAGEFRDALAVGTFHGEHDDGSFSFDGTASSEFAWAEMGHQQNGSFLNSNRSRGGVSP